MPATRIISAITMAPHFAPPSPLSPSLSLPTASITTIRSEYHPLVSQTSIEICYGRTFSFTISTSNHTHQVLKVAPSPHPLLRSFCLSFPFILLLSAALYTLLTHSPLYRASLTRFISSSLSKHIPPFPSQIVPEKLYAPSSNSSPSPLLSKTLVNKGFSSNFTPAQSFLFFNRTNS